MKKSLKFTISTLIVVVLVIPLLTFLGNYLGWQKIIKLKVEAQQFFSEFEKYSYEKRVSFGTEEGNAWDYYQNALKKTQIISTDFWSKIAPNLNPSEMQDTIKMLNTWNDAWSKLHYFLNNVKLETGELISSDSVEMILKTKQDIINNILEGLKQRNCLIPFVDSEGEYMITIPLNYSKYPTVLLSAQGRLELIKGNNKRALLNYLDAILFLQDIIGGGNDLLDYLYCHDYAELPLNEIEKSLESGYFEKPALLYLTMVFSLSDETSTFFGRYVKIESKNLTRFINEGRVPFSYYIKLPDLKYWRYMFSNIFAYASFLADLDQCANFIFENETDDWITTKMIYDTALLRSIESNPISDFWPEFKNLKQMHNRVFIHKARIRLYLVGAFIQLYKTEKEVYPPVLESLNIEEQKQILVDPISGKQWKYIISTNGDSATISGTVNTLNLTSGSK